MDSGDQAPKITESAKKCVGGGEGEGVEGEGGEGERREGEGGHIPNTRQILGIKKGKVFDAARGKDETMTIIINFFFFDAYLPPIYRWMFRNFVAYNSITDNPLLTGTLLS